MCFNEIFFFEARYFISIYSFILVFRIFNIEFGWNVSSVMFLYTNRSFVQVQRVAKYADSRDYSFGHRHDPYFVDNIEVSV